MPFNGAGTFTRTNGVNTGSGTWAADAAAGTPILASRADAHDQDIADGLSSCITKDGQTNPTNNLPMNSYRHTGVGNASSRSDYAAAGQVQDSSLVYAGASTGSSNAYVLTMTPAIGSYVTGQTFTFLPNFTNTGATTVNVNSKGAKTVQFLGQTLVGGEIVSSIPATLVYDGTQFQLLNHGGAWVDYTPSVAATGSMTVSSLVINAAKYQRHGSMVFIAGAVTFTLGGTTSNTVTITLPIAGADNYQVLTASFYNGTSIIAAAGYTNASTLNVRQYDASNYALGASREIRYSGIYRV